jgi:hypothetical protein
MGEYLRWIEMFFVGAIYIEESRLFREGSYIWQMGFCVL